MAQKALMFAMRQTEREWHDFMKRTMNQLGIPGSYRHIIGFLSHNPGVSQKEIAEEFEISFAAVSQTVKEMERSGYLRKERSAEDGRSSRLFLTQKGEEASARVREKIREADRMLTEVLTPEKEAELVAELERITETIRQRLTD